MKYKKNLSGDKAESDLNKALKEYEDWRRNRPNRGVIPDHLWESAVKLCKAYSIHQVVKALRLNYKALKKRVEPDLNQKKQSEKRRRKSKRNSRNQATDVFHPIDRKTSQFIDLTTYRTSPPFHSQSDNIVLEYQKTDGNNLKIHIPQGIELNLREIISAFSGERSS